MARWVGLVTVRRRAPVRWSSSFVVVSVVCVVALAPGVRANPALSVNDEATHLDNAWRYAHVDLPQIGEPISAEILSEWTCRGFYDPDVTFPECVGVDAVASARFPFSVSNYNTKHPPLYYVVNGVVGRLVVLVTPVDSFVSAARLANGLWMAVAVLLVWGVCGMLGLTGWRRLPVVALALVAPVAFGGWFFVNNDVGSYVASWAILAAFLRAASVGLAGGLGAVMATSVAGVFVKGFTIGAVIAGAVMLWLSVPDRSLRTPSGRALSVRVGGVVAASTAGVVAWLVVDAMFPSDIPYRSPIARPPLRGIPWSGISEQIVSFAAPIGKYPGWLTGNGTRIAHGVDLWALGLVWLVSAVPLALLLMAGNTSTPRLSRAIGISALIGSPAIAAVIIAFNLIGRPPEFVKIIDRYRISVVPVGLVALAYMSVGRQRLLVGLGSFVALGCLLVGTAYVSAVI